MKEICLETYDGSPCEWAIIVNEEYESRVVAMLAINWLMVMM